MLRTGLLLVLTSGLVHGDVCSYVITRDCNASPTAIICGTDGLSYRNNCYLAKAYCANKFVHKAHDGSCAAPTTTPSPLHGSQVAFDIFCMDLMYITCPPNGIKICGTDGKYYNNVCQYDKARCFHRSLRSNGTNCS